MARKAYNRRKLEQQYREELKRLSKQFLLDKKCTGDIFKVYIVRLRTKITEFFLLKNESKCWTELCKYVKRRKGNRKNIPAIKNGNGRLINDSIEKANSFNFYYSSSVFSCESSIPQIQRANSGEPL
jgi:hypothetical protein